MRRASPALDATNGSDDNRKNGFSSPSAPAKLSAMASLASATAFNCSRDLKPDFASACASITSLPATRSATALAKKISPSPGSDVAGYSLASTQRAAEDCATANGALRNAASAQATSDPTGVIRSSSSGPPGTSPFDTPGAPRSASGTRRYLHTARGRSPGNTVA